MVREVLEGHRSLGRTKRTRIVVIGLCLLLCGVSFIDLEAKPEYKPVNEALDRLRLRSEGCIHLLRDHSIPREHLFSIDSYKTWFENKHLWVHVQGVLVNDIPLGILYVEFRNEEEAEAGLRSRLACLDESLHLEGRRFGRFAVFVSRCSYMPEMATQKIFEALERRSLSEEEGSGRIRISSAG